MSLEASGKYLSLEKQYSVHTVKAYMRDLRQFQEYCEQEHGETALENMPYTVIRSWIISQMESGRSHRTVNRKVASLKSYYKFLMRKGQLSASPLSAHRALKTDRKVEVPFSVDEMSKLLAQVPFEADFEGARDQLLVELLYTTGIRRAELIGIRIADLDLNAGTLRVLGKRNKQRIVPLVKSLLPLFNRYLALRHEAFPNRDIPFLFLSGSGNKIYETLVYRTISKYLGLVSEKAKKSPHVLRHTFATHMLNQGADMNSVKELLGHASLASTQVYTHNSIAELKRIHLNSHPRNKD